jgi:TRAP-type C4-dicarboxylate transport system substrate-binding protein
MKKKILIAIALMLVVSLALAGCGGGGGSSDAQEEPSSAAPAEDADAAPADDTGAADNEGFAEEPEVKLILTQHDPDESMPGQYCFAWAEMVREKSKGRIEIQVNNNGTLAKPAESLDMVRSGAVDLAWGLQSFYPDVFPLTDAIALPMLDLGTSAQAAQAVMDIWLNTDLLQDEYKDYKVIMIRPSYTSPILTNKKIEKIEDFQGMKMRISGAPLIDFFDRFNVKAEGVPINELYSVLQNGSFDGAVTDWHAVYSFKLWDVAKYYADDKMTYTTYYFLMNLDKYNSLPDDLKAVIDECSNQNALDLNIDSWDTIVDEGRKGALDKGDEIYNIDEETLAQMKVSAEESTKKWISDMEAKGLRGQEMYDTLMEYSAKYKG